jgi:hypothetical protein
MVLLSCDVYSSRLRRAIDGSVWAPFASCPPVLSCESWCELVPTRREGKCEDTPNSATSGVEEKCEYGVKSFSPSFRELGVDLCEQQSPSFLTLA